MQSFEHRLEDELEPRAGERGLGRQSADGAVTRLASTMGNRAFASVAERGGVLPDGRAHPDVEAAIARTSGSGRSLDGSARERFAPLLGDSFNDVRVHTDALADMLARAVSARAFTAGRDLYFASGEYRPGSNPGDRLLAHELTHAVQQRGAPVSGPLRVSQPGDTLELEADAVAGELIG
jgi:Domain of unknown function (DUF4157)